MFEQLTSMIFQADFLASVIRITAFLCYQYTIVVR